MKKWWIPYQHITCMKQVDRIPHPTRQLHMIKSLKKGPTYSTTNVESCWNNNNSSKDNQSHIKFYNFDNLYGFKWQFCDPPLYIARPRTSCEIGYLNELWVQIRTNNNNIIIIGNHHYWMWKSTILVALTNNHCHVEWQICPPNQSNCAQISKLLTRKTRFFIYYFIFVPNAKQSAWVYTPQKSPTHYRRKNKGIIDISTHAFVYNLIPVIGPRVKTQNFRFQFSM